MLNTKFFDDFENIKDWVEEELSRVGQGDTVEKEVYVAALEKFRDLNNELHTMFYDQNTYQYRQPTEEEMEADSTIQEKFDALDEYYQEIMQATKTYFDFVNKENKANQTKREKWQEWKNNKNRKKEDEPEKPQEDIKISATFRMIHNYAKRDMWEREDAKKEKHPLADLSVPLKNLREAMDAPTTIEELTAMEEQLKEFVNQEQEIENKEKTTDEISDSTLTEDEKDDILEGASQEELEEKKRVEEELNKRKEEEKKREEEFKQKNQQMEQAFIKEEADKKAAEELDKLKKLKEDAQKELKESSKEREELETANAEANKILNSDVDELLKRMEKADKTWLHVNSEEFINMRDSLYALAKMTADIKKSGTQSLSQETRKELQEKIEALRKATDCYIDRKGMGKQKTPLGKSRIDLAYAIGNYLTDVKENSRKKYNALEKKEIRRLQWEEDHKEELAAIKEEQKAIAKFSEISEIYGKNLYQFSKVAENVEQVPGETFFQRRFNASYQNLKKLMESNADVRLVRMARSDLWKSRYLMTKHDGYYYDSLEDEVKEAIANMPLYTSPSEKKSMGDADKFRNDPQFFKDQLKEYQPLLERLGQQEDVHFTIKHFVQEYNNFINESDEKKLKPEYVQVRLKDLRWSLVQVANIVKRDEIDINDDELGVGEGVTSSDLSNYIREVIVDKFEYMERELLGISNKQIRQEINHHDLVNDYNRQYGKLLDQIAEKCPEVKEAREWLQEEMQSKGNNSSRTGAFFIEKLQNAITEENIRNNGIELEGVKDTEIADVVKQLKNGIQSNYYYMYESYFMGARALKQREDRKIIEQRKEKVDEIYSEKRDHVKDFYDKLTDALLVMNDGSGPYYRLLERHATLGELLEKGLDPIGDKAINTMNNVLISLETIAGNKDIKDKDRIQKVLNDITKECKEAKGFSVAEKNRIATEKKNAAEKAREEKLNKTYPYKDLRTMVKEQFPKLKEQGIFKDYDQDAKKFEKYLLDFKKGKDALDNFVKMNTIMGEILKNQPQIPAKDIVQQLSGQIETSIQDIKNNMVKEKWDSYFKNNKYEIDRNNKLHQTNDPKFVELRREYKQRLIAMEVLGIDGVSVLEKAEHTRLGAAKDNYQSEEAVWSKIMEVDVFNQESMNCIDGYLNTTQSSKENLPSGLLLMKRLQDNKKIVMDLKTVDKLLKNEKITSQDMVQDKVRIEMAKFSHRMLNKIGKTPGEGRKNFIVESAAALTNMLNSYEKFLNEKLKDKELSFYKNNPEMGDLYKEWKGKQLERIEELKKQGKDWGNDRDQLKAASIKSKIAQQKEKLLDEGKVFKEVEEKYAIAEVLKLPLDGLQTKKREIEHLDEMATRRTVASDMYYDILTKQSDWKKHKPELVYWNTRSIMAALATYTEMEGATGLYPQMAKSLDQFTKKRTSVKFPRFNTAIEYYRYQKDGVSQVNKDNVLNTATHKKLGFKDFESYCVEEENHIDIYAYDGMQKALLDSSLEIDSSFALHIGETLAMDDKRLRVLPKTQQPDPLKESVKIILQVQQTLKEGSLVNLKFIDALNKNETATIGDCRDAYKNLAKAQLAMEIVRELQGVENRAEYLNKEKIENIKQRFEKLDKFLDEKMPEYLKTGNPEVADLTTMNKTMFLLSDDKFKAFKEMENQLGTLQKNEEMEETAEFGK